MYDIKKLIHGNHVTVGEVISELQKLPQNAVFTCCGDEYLFIHVEEDGSVVTIDTETLSDVYPEEICDIFPSDYEIPRFGGSLHRDMMQVRYTPDKNEIERIEKHDYDLHENGLYWIKEEDFLSEKNPVDIYGGVFVENPPVGTIDKKYLNFTANRYCYKDYIRGGRKPYENK